MKMKNFLLLFAALSLILMACEPVDPLFDAPSKESIQSIINKLDPLERITELNIDYLTDYSLDPKDGRIMYAGERVNMPINSNFEVFFGYKEMLLGILDGDLFAVICKGEIVMGPMAYKGKTVIGGWVDYWEKYIVGYLMFSDGQIAVAIIGGTYDQFFHYD